MCSSGDPSIADEGHAARLGRARQLALPRPVPEAGVRAAHDERGRSRHGRRPEAALN